MYVHNNILDDKIRRDNLDFNLKWIEQNKLIKSENISVSEFENPNPNSSPMMVVWLKNIDRLMCLKPKSVNINNYSFVDVGCGVGISTIYFRENYVFKDYCGFDFEKLFIRFSKLNLSLTTKDDINFFVDDIVNFHVQDKPSFLYLFNPFNLNLIKIFIENNLEKLKKHHSIIGYVNDIHVDYFESLDVKIIRNDYFNISMIFF